MVTHAHTFRALVLLTDAFGAVGGIQLYNRDLLSALCAHPDCLEVVALPRQMRYPCEPLPLKLSYLLDGLDSTTRYCRTLLKTIMGGRFDFVICGHLNLLPLAWLASRLCRVPLILELYGIEAWQAPRNLLKRLIVRDCDVIATISRLTVERFDQWAKRRRPDTVLLPNAIHLDQYATGRKDPGLVQRYGLEGKTVLMTFGRLVSHERQKGFDEVLHLIPELSPEYPDLVYLIAGDGPDRARLEQVATERGIADRVVFTGRVPEEEKADYYRLADVYVMPSRGEGFGFVFLEAMACGIPVIASRVDGSREAVRDGLLGQIVDPDDPAELKQALRDALAKPRGVIPVGLDYFSFENFTRRVWDLVDRVVVRVEA